MWMPDGEQIGSAPQQPIRSLDSFAANTATNQRRDTMLRRGQIEMVVTPMSKHEVGWRCFKGCSVIVISQLRDWSGLVWLRLWWMAKDESVVTDAKSG